MLAFVIVPVLIIIFAAIFLVADYFLYRFVFCHPLKKRPDIHNIPESNLYKAHRGIMSEVVNEMETDQYEDVSIMSKDGCRLCGRYYDIKKDAPVMIFFHGYHGVFAWDGYGGFKVCQNNGINILMVDERAHGRSGGSAITFGIKERYDCKLWAEYAAKRFGDSTDIFLAGVSMGAASVMMASELGLPQNVRAIVADCGYSEPAAIIKETVKMMKLPVEPIYSLIKLGAYIFGHFDLEEATALKAVKQLEIPILFIHGKQDSVVPVDMCKELYENCTSRKEIVLIDGADHANSAMTDYETYEKSVVSFLKSAM